MAEEQVSENEEDMGPLKTLFTSEDWDTSLEDAKLGKEDVRKLVMNFFIAKGHQEVAERFQKETGTMPGVDIVSIIDRLAVIKAIQCGNIEEAVEKLNALNPEILRTNFILQQQRFIELVREMKTSEALAFAQGYLTPFVDQSSPKPYLIQEAYLKELEETVTLLAFEDPFTCPRKDLLDKSRWFKTASDVNAALVTSQTGAKDAKLHSLLKMLVWIQDQLEAVYPRMSDLSTGQLIDPPK